MVNMSASWKMASMVVLPLSLVLAGVGCIAQAPDEEPADEAATVADDAPAASDAAKDEQTGEASEACGGSFWNSGGLGCGLGGGLWSGWGLGSCGGWGLGDW